jgi:anti-sigma-K factor RskA
VTPDIHDLVGAYCVDALEPAEHAAFEAHLPGCPDCREEVAANREALAALAGAHPVLPPAGIVDAVLAEVRGGTKKAGTTPDAGPAPGRLGAAPAQGDAEAPDARAGAATRRRDRGPSAWLAAAAVGALLFAGGVVVGRAGAPAADVAESAAMSSVLAVASAADAHVLPVDLMGAPSRVIMSQEMGKVAFVAEDLPTPAKGQCYQVWKVTADGSKESVGVVTPDADGHIAVVLEGAGDGATEFVITLEPPGGSKQPTGDMVGSAAA